MEKVGEKDGEGGREGWRGWKRRMEWVGEKDGAKGEERVGNRVRRMKLQEGQGTTSCYSLYTHCTGHAAK